MTTQTSHDSVNRPRPEKKQRKQNKRSLQLEAMKKKAQDEDRYFKQCQSRKGNRKVPSEADLFGKQGSQGINFAKYDDIRVEVERGADVAVPQDFGALALGESLKANIDRMGYKALTPIQKHAIPSALRNHDLMCCAQTGSGKTCAFLLPVIARLNAVEASPGPATPRCVVLAPTRELAIQIYDECQKLCYHLPVYPVAVYGGANAKPQLEQLAHGVDIVVATPGRLTDFVERNIVSLTLIKFLVLDEADRMMDMGFLPQMKRIISHMPKIRQTMMFSATFDAPMQKLAASFLRESYTWVAVGRVGSSTDSITQKIIRCTQDKRKKLALVVSAIQEGPAGRTLIFVQKKRSATWVKKMLKNGGPSDGDSFEPIAAEDIHGDRSQSQRENALNKFRSGEIRVLVATDVAARGLDIAGVEHVVNMDLPVDDFDSYVHRIGRTGRAGHTGLATSLFVPADNEKIADMLVHQLKETNQEIPGWLEAFVLGGGVEGRGRGSMGNDVRKTNEREGRGRNGGRGGSRSHGGGRQGGRGRGRGRGGRSGGRSS